MAKYVNIIDLPNNLHWIENVEKWSYDKGTEDAWKFAGKIQSMTCEQMYEIFGINNVNYDDFCNEITYQEANDKYEAWKKQKKDIRVGDEVESIYGGWKGVVVDIDYEGDLTIMNERGDVGTDYVAKTFRKTGRHFDVIDELLKKMKEE